MGNKDIDNELMLEETSDEVLLEETSGTEAMLEESTDNEVLLEETSDIEVLLEEDSSESVLLEEYDNKRQKTEEVINADPSVKYEIIPEGIETIGVFDHVIKETSEGVIFPSSLKKIESNLQFKRIKYLDFSNCTQLEEIGSSAFEDCQKLESVILPPSLKTINDFAFCSCPSLKTIDFSNCSLLEEIGECAFVLCEKLESIDLSQCSHLENIADYIGVEIILPQSFS